MMLSTRYARGFAMITTAALLAALPAGGSGCAKSSPANEKSTASEPAPVTTTAAGARGDQGAADGRQTAQNLAPPEKADAPSPAGPGAGGMKPKMAARAFAEGEEKGGWGGAAPPPSPQAGSIAPSPSPTAAAPREAVIDPNGRFATTYRPGGGHLAAFESAVARGIVPNAERELISDVGARYAASFDVPKGKALTVKTDFERSKLAPTGGPTHMRLTLRSTSDAPAGRPHLSVHLVLDISGSMAGESIQRAREAARALVDKLAPSDDFSLVTFSSDAQVKVPDGPVGPRRESIKSTIAGIVEGGGTNIGQGLTLGYEQAASRSIPEDAVRVVLLLSDGRANSGITSTTRLSKLALDAFQSGVQTSSFGLGADYDGELMSSIANDGAGGYYYLRDPEQITPALSTELDKRLDPVATAVELRVRLRKGVDLLHVYGSQRLTDAEAARVRAIEVAADKQAEKRDKIKTDRQDDLEGGMRFFIPAFARGDSHAILLKLALPEGTNKRDVAFIELKYKDRVAKKNVSDEFPASLAYGQSDGESAASIDPSVARTVQGFAAGETLAEASTRIARGDRQGAASLLTEREGILRQAATTLNEPLFLKDADRLARLRTHADSTSGVGDPLVLAMLLETASRTHMR